MKYCQAGAQILAFIYYKLNLKHFSLKLRPYEFAQLETELKIQAQY